MEYAALFVWLSLCLLVGAAVHYILAGAMESQIIKLIAAPGNIVRKFTMALTALFCGATVTKAKLYELSSRDVEFNAEGASSVAKAIVPLMPLFGCAAAMMVLNALFLHPFRLDYTPPALSAFDTGGIKGFIGGTWDLLTQVVRRGASVDWGNLRLYVLLALTFSLALGAAASFDQVKEAILGAGLLAVALAVFCSITVRRGFLGSQNPMTWAVELRSLVVTASAAAFVMMVYGMLTALAVGIVVRVYEMIGQSGSGSKSSGRTKDLSEERGSKKRRAA